MFFRLCYRLGFYPVKIKSPVQTYTYLKNKPDMLKEDALQKLSYAVRWGKDQGYYTELLEQFVPTWNGKKEIEESTFIGEGYGRSSLNAYRKVKISGEYFFEKVYFHSHADLRKLEMMEKLGLTEQLATKIILPRIKKIYSGELLSIVYFDFLKTDPANRAGEQELIHLTKLFYKWHWEQLIAESSEKWELLKDFTQHHQYEKFKKAAAIKLQKEGLEIENFERSAKTGKLVVTHGDLQKSNVFKPNLVMDWDSFGFYPIGFEVAFLYFRLVFKEEKTGNPFDWLRENYQREVDAVEWEKFEKNFTFFLFVFAQELFLEQQEKELEKRLLTKLKAVS